MLKIKLTSENVKSDRPITWFIDGLGDIRMAYAVYVVNGTVCCEQQTPGIAESAIVAWGE